MVDAEPGEASPPRWRAVGETVAGASHVRAGIPNQDSLHLPAAPGLPMVVAVSDGHGSPKCFRSHLGSRFAVGAAAVALREFLAAAPEGEGPAKREERAKGSLPGEITRRWREAVELDLALSPLTADELTRVEEKSGEDGRRAVEASPELAYGATVLAVAIDERSLTYVQLGDGDILVVSEAGDVARPLPGDERLFAGETTSLATPTAAGDFRVKVRKLSGFEPALVLLTTDGYANSFKDDAGFLKVGADILEMITASGLDAVAADVKGWLEEATRLGSGDDVTLALVCRAGAVRPREEPAAAGDPPFDPPADDPEGDGEAPAPEGPAPTPGDDPGVAGQPAPGPPAGEPPAGGGKG